MSLLRVLGHVLLTIVVGTVVVVVVIPSSDTVSIRVRVLLGRRIRGVGVVRWQDVVVVPLTPSSKDGSEDAEPKQHDESKEDHGLWGGKDDRLDEYRCEAQSHRSITYQNDRHEVDVSPT